MGVFTTAKKAWDASTDAAAGRGRGRVVKSTGMSAGHCAACGRPARKSTAGVPHCHRPACLRKIGDLW